MRKRKPLLVGLTGGIGSGKSTIARIFEWFKIPVYYSDDRAKWLISNDDQIKSEIVALLGKKSYNPKGEYNRKYVSSVVFEDKEKLAALNEIVHPRVSLDFDKWVNSHLNSPYIIKEAAILIESKGHLEMDRLIVVSASKMTRIQRVMKRDGISETMVKNRMKNQMPENKKLTLADYVIENNKKSGLIENVADIHENLLSLTKKE